jgi:hypothetical protein
MANWWVYEGVNWLSGVEGDDTNPVRLQDHQIRYQLFRIQPARDDFNALLAAPDRPEDPLDPDYGNLERLTIAEKERLNALIEERPMLIDTMQADPQDTSRAHCHQFNTAGIVPYRRR